MREETGEAGGPLTSHLSGSNGTGQARTKTRRGRQKEREAARNTESERRNR